MNAKKEIRRGLPIGIIIVLLLGCTPAAQKVAPGDYRLTRPGATSVVVVHSRSGNTALVAKLLADAAGATYLRLKAPEGTGDSLISSPNRNAEVAIEPRTVDLSAYRTVFLGTPIWFWHPAAPICTFIRANDLTGKHVVLFYTYQGGLAKTAIDEWKALVAKRGGTVVDVIGVNRKMHATDEALAAEVKSIIAGRLKSLLPSK